MVREVSDAPGAFAIRCRCAATNFGFRVANGSVVAAAAMLSCATRPGPTAWKRRPLAPPAQSEGSVKETASFAGLNVCVVGTFAAAVTGSAPRARIPMTTDRRIDVGTQATL